MFKDVQISRHDGLGLKGAESRRRRRRDVRTRRGLVVKELTKPLDLSLELTVVILEGFLKFRLYFGLFRERVVR
jgi:hypothetical protein